MARLIFCYPDRVPRHYSEQGLSEDVAFEWERVVNALWRLPMRELDGRPAPRVVRLAADAAGAWAEWCRAHYAEQESAEFRGSLEGPWGKLEAYAGRLALVLHLMALASDPMRPETEEIPDLTRRTIEAAFRLVAYFKSHAVRVYAAIGGKNDDGGDDVQSLTRWIRRNSLAEFSESDITRNIRRFRDDRAAMADALVWMVTHNVIRRREAPEGTAGPGRKHTAVYDVNPRLLRAPQNCQN
jgi:hypothetical protein